MRYADELRQAMCHLGRVDRTVFVGQAVACPGTAISGTLVDVPPDRLLELPVAEEMQLGLCIGLSLAGFLPVSIFPRWNFLLSGISQLVNHLDKITLMAGDGFAAKAIVRTGIGSERPLHPQHQHVGDFTDAIRAMCRSIEVIRLDDPAEIFPAYQRALLRDDGRSTLLVEWGDYYNEK